MADGQRRWDRPAGRSSPASAGRHSVVACVDFGSTFTKAALVDVDTGALLATATHRTTIETDVLDGWDACRAALATADPRAADAEVLACSSAGGGLRIGVVGNEELVTAEAGRRVALSSGGRVVHVTSGGLDDGRLAALRAAEPDVVLLVGGTDGGNAEVLLACAGTLARSRWTGPVVVAGNIDVQAEVAGLLDAARTPYVLADNVVPRIGVLAPDSARGAIREMFLRHVIGGKHLSGRAAFTEMVQGATPDVVLTAVELLASAASGDVVVVDVGGATTDVHSVVEPDPEVAGLSREVVATVPVSRTVEADLGMRWSAVSTVDEGVTAGLLPDSEELRAAAVLRRERPGFLPGDERESHDDEVLATAAVGVALRRHAGRRQVGYDEGARVVRRSGKDLRQVGVLVGSGGVLRAAAPETAHRVLASVTGADVPGGWQLPRDPRLVVDVDYLMAPIGLLARTHPAAASALVRRILRVGATPPPSLGP